MKNINLIIEPFNSPQKTCDVFCFPYAGAGASVFLKLIAHFRPEMQPLLIQLPGRESRIHDPLYKNMEIVITEITTSLVEAIDRPFIFWGHSMGALIAYEIAKNLKKKHNISPALLVSSGCQAPHIYTKSFGKSMDQTSDQELIAQLINFNHMSEKIYQNHGVMKLLLPRLRADFSVLETYQPTLPERIMCPILVLSGTDDKIVSFEQSQAWEEYANETFHHKTFSGGHFFIHEHSLEVVNTINHFVSQSIQSIY